MKNYNFKLVSMSEIEKTKKDFKIEIWNTIFSSSKVLGTDDFIIGVMFAKSEQVVVLWYLNDKEVFDEMMNKFWKLKF